tara:strand:- start:211 stop:486 length:276 start_codon:yes stop_codon:yes gene_type:complete
LLFFGGNNGRVSFTNIFGEISTNITGITNMELDNNYILIYKPTIDKYTLHNVHDESVVLDTLDTLAAALETMTRYIVIDSKKGVDNAVEEL